MLVEPRVGLAYDLTGDGKTALRGSVGIFHNTRVSGNVNWQASRNPPLQLNPQIFYGTMNTLLQIDRLDLPEHGAGLRPGHRRRRRSTAIPPASSATSAGRRSWTSAYVGSRTRHLLQTREPEPGALRRAVRRRRTRIRRARATRCPTTSSGRTRATATSTSSRTTASPTTTRCRCRRTAGSPAACSSASPTPCRGRGTTPRRRRPAPPRDASRPTRTCATGPTACRRRYGLIRGHWRTFPPRPDDGRFFAERMTVRLAPGCTDQRSHDAMAAERQGHPSRARAGGRPQGESQRGRSTAAASARLVSRRGAALPVALADACDTRRRPTSPRRRCTTAGARS